MRAEAGFNGAAPARMALIDLGDQRRLALRLARQRLLQHLDDVARCQQGLGLRSLDTRVGIYQVTQRVMEGRIAGVCLCRDGGLRRLGDGQKLLWYWNP